MNKIRVTWRHQVPEIWEDPLTQESYKIPGHTYCQVTLETGEELHAFAHCSAEDQFSRKVGRRVSLKRAISGLNRDLRTAVWYAVEDQQFNSGQILRFLRPDNWKGSWNEYLKSEGWL